MATPGGNRLRALREFRGKTQLEVELDASLGIGYLQRVESGKVKYPERDTLERILTALGAHYTERRDILELFGYVVDAPLPDDAEIQNAVEACRADLENAALPAYLLDCAHRLLTWNTLAEKLLGEKVFRGTKLASMLRLLFDPDAGITSLIANPDIFFRAQIRTLRYEMHVFQNEAWWDVLIDDMCQKYPLFNHYWAAVIAEQRQYPTAARPLILVALNLPDIGTLRFRLTSEPFAQDRRFRIIYYIPADAATIQQCAVWSETNNP
jgi:transcriptional regulator with XRE-family HTH domain